MPLIDHLFVAVFAIIVPIIGFISFRRLLGRIAAGKHEDRGQMYMTTTATQWALFAVAIGTWWYAARPWSDLGLSFTADLNFLIGVALTLTGIAFFVVQILQMRKADIDENRRMRASFGDMALVLPRNGNELARFYMLSLTAGIVEEVLWRGFLFWYLGQFMPLWAAAVISTIGFGLGHAYQGLSQLPGVTLVGAAFAALYLLTGSLWLSIILHVAVDVLQGCLAYEVMHRSEFDDPDAGDHDALLTA